MKTLWQALRQYLVNLGASAVQGWSDFWFKPADPATLALVRICVGLAVLYSYLRMTPDVLDYIGPEGLVDDTAYAQLSAGGQETSPLAPWYGWSLWSYVRNPSTILVFHHYFLMAIICFTCGLFSRSMNLVVWLGHLSYLHRGYMLWYGVDAMLSFLLLCLLVGPTGRVCSIDDQLRRYWNKKQGKPLDPLVEPPRYWTANLSIRLIQIHMCVVYLCSGLSKLQGESWWDGSAVLQIFMLDDIAPFDYRWIGHMSDRALSVLSSSAVAVTLAYEIGFAFLIWNRTLRPLVLFLGFLLHAGIGLVMGLGLFSTVMLIGCAAFLNPESLRWFWRTLLNKHDTAVASTPVA